MIDYIKIVINSQLFANDLRNNHLLKNSWSCFTNKSTGNTIDFASYKGLRFKIYPSGRVEIDGSIHKHFNNGESNFNDYSYASLLITLIGLKNAFGEEILNGRIENLEYGLNILLPSKVDEFLKRVIVYLNKGARLTEPITKDDSKGYSKGIRFTLSEKAIKIYNKGLQYAKGEHLLRCEYKTIKMRSIEHIGIVKLLDLTDTTKLAALHQCLMSSFNDILIREEVHENELTKAEVRIYNECINPHKWVSMDKHKRTERKAQYKAILASKSQSDIKTVVRDLLNAKHSQLNCTDSKTAYLLTELLKIEQTDSNLGFDCFRILNTHYFLTGVQNGKALLSHS